MTRVIHAELRRLLRRRTIIATSVLCATFGAVATIAVWAAAKASGPLAARGGTSLARLASSAGATEAFAVGTSFIGFFVFVTFIALVAAEFSGGTYRALLLRDPHRVRLVAGKLVAALTIAAGALVLTEVVSVVTSIALAPSKDISTANWFTAAGLGHGVGNLATVFAGVAGWAIVGATLGVIFRSAPLALGVGFAWAGPIENITVRSWSTGYRVFPGQVLGALIQGGTPELSLTRAAVTGAAYVAAAALAATTLLTRRDVTS